MAHLLNNEAPSQKCNVLKINNKRAYKEKKVDSKKRSFNDAKLIIIIECTKYFN